MSELERSNISCHPTPSIFRRKKMEIHWETNCLKSLGISASELGTEPWHSASQFKDPMVSESVLGQSLFPFKLGS